jgi:hypothetical protein
MTSDGMMIWLRKLFVCWWGGCGMVTQVNDTHVWGQCQRCGKTAGICTREALRRYSDTKARQEAAERKAQPTIDRP